MVGTLIAPLPAAAAEKMASKDAKKKSSRKSKSSKEENLNWNTNGDGISTDEEWVQDDLAKESPSTWDPQQFDKQTGDLDPWKDSDEPTRVQDLPSPTLADAEPGQRTAKNEEEWPFKSPCSFKEKNRRKLTPRSGKSEKSDASVASDIDSLDSDPKPAKSKSGGSKKEKGDSAPTAVKRTVSEEGDDLAAAASSQLERSRDSNSRGSGRKDSGPSMPRRNRNSGHDTEDGNGLDRPLSKTKGLPESTELEESANVKSSNDRPKKPKRRTPRPSASDEGSNEGTVSSGNDDDEGLGKGSFHKLSKDFDKPSKSSRSKKPKGSSSVSGSSRRRRVKDRSMDNSGHNDDDDDDVDEFGEEDREEELKGEDGELADATGSGPRLGWRERRAQNRKTREQNLGEEPSAADAFKTSARRPPPSRRGNLRRASSERWMRTVEEGDPGDYGDTINRRARNTLVGASSDLSRSAHAIRRYHSGGIARMSAGLGTASYHGTSRTPRRPTRQVDSVDSAGSFGEDYESYDMNLSGRSSRTLDSIEDYEDFGTIDFQTPGMVDYDEEIIDLMQRANPEHTSHLNRRVHRKREAVNYDQDMPMMTRQALLTRQASSQVQRQFVDGSNIDRRRLMLRSDSTSSMASRDELSRSNHRSMRPAPGGRRPPPRTRSTGMGAMVRGDFMGQSAAEPDDRRRLFRTRSTTTNSFRQYQNKPNRVASLSRRDQGDPSRRDQGDPHSMRGAHTSISAGPENRRGMLQRAKSTTALRRPGKSITPTKPSRRVPKTIETKAASPSKGTPDLKSSPAPPSEEKRKKTRPPKEDSPASDSEDSDVNSVEEPVTSKPPKRKPSKATPTKASTSPVKKSKDKRDMTMKRNRQKLHSMVYGAKMGVDMKDLFKQVQRGEIPTSPIKTLMMPSP